MKRALLFSLLMLSACSPSKTQAPIYKYGVNKGAGNLGMHSVQSGETLYAISQKYNLDLRELIETNHLSPPFKIATGSRLQLPAPQTYTVKDKDSLYTISRMFDTTQTEIARLNRLSQPYKLAQGQVLKIPKVYGSNEIETASATSAAPPVIAQPVEPEPIESAPLPPPVVTASTDIPAPPQPEPQKNAEVKSTSETKAPVTKSPATPSVSKPLPASSGKFIKPVNGKIISSYGPKPDGQHNDGINIQAAKGDAVRAADSGQVAYIGSEIEGYGKLILLKHQNRYVTAYAHLGKILVKKGDNVMRGQTIGTVGQTGFVDKPQLHFEIRQGKTALDPAKLI